MAKKVFLRLLASGLLLYSVLGILLHLFFRLGITEHHCNLLVGEEQEHLMLFTIATSFSALLFNLIKRKRRAKPNLP